MLLFDFITHPMILKLVYTITLGNPVNKGLAKKAAKEGVKSAAGDAQSVVNELHKFIHGIIANPGLSLITLIVIGFLIFASVKASTLLDRQRARDAYRGRRDHMRKAQEQIKAHRKQAQAEYEDNFDKLDKY